MKLGIIIGSIREGRSSQYLAALVEKQANNLDGVETTVLDLRDFNLPMFNEAISPKYNPNRRTNTEGKKWLDALSAQDAFVIVSPEYNRAVPGVLKNAFDYIAHEVSDKPFALISHGSYNGGFTLANLRVMVPELGGISIPAMIGIQYGQFDEKGTYIGDESTLTGRIDSQLADLRRYSEALMSVRN